MPHCHAGKLKRHVDVDVDVDADSDVDVDVDVNVDVHVNVDVNVNVNVNVNVDVWRRGSCTFVIGPWSLVLGPWSLVLGFWSLVLFLVMVLDVMETRSYWRKVSSAGNGHNVEGKGCKPRAHRTNVPHCYAGKLTRQKRQLRNIVKWDMLRLLSKRL